jgi:hypothetical protein
MSPKNSLLNIGLTALGVFGSGVLHSAAAVAQVPAGPPAAPAPVAAPAPAPSPSVLLLSDGRTLEGTLRVEGSDYVLRQKGGEIRFKKTAVAGTFGSLAEVYQFKQAQIPDDDPDEHLKLARWCLSGNLRAEARVELTKVVAVSEHAAVAKAMLASIEASETRMGPAQVDSDVVRTAGETVDPASGAKRAQRPGELDPEMLRRATKDLGVTGRPVIFDLPPAVAARRADQFATTVHRILQARCAKCHNERHDGAFQLVEVKTRKDWTQAALRSNLDATLQLVDPDNPSRSELLARSLVPHGNGAMKRPIFSGSNDREFQILAAWVNSLRGAPASTRGNDPRLGGPTRDPQVSTTGSFASDRTPGPLPYTATTNGPAIGPVDASGGLPSNVHVDVVAPPATRYVPGRGMVVENTPPAAGEFPVSPLVSGRLPTIPGAAPQPVGSPALLPPALPGPDGSLPPPAEVSQPGVPGAPAQAPPAAATPAKKPVKIDPGLLQKALESRNNAR